MLVLVAPKPPRGQASRGEGRILDEHDFVTKTNGAEHDTFTQDDRFDSPSTASGVIVGANIKGRRAWCSTDATMLRDLK